MSNEHLFLLDNYHERTGSTGTSTVLTFSQLRCQKMFRRSLALGNFLGNFVHACDTKYLARNNFNMVNTRK